MLADLRMPSIDLTGYRLIFDEEFNTRSISQTGQGTTWANIRSQWRHDANSDIGFSHSSFVDAPPATTRSTSRVARSRSRPCPTGRRTAILAAGNPG